MLGLNISFDTDSLLTFVHSHDFIVTVSIIAFILVVAGFIFKTFLKAAFITAVIIILGSLFLQLIPDAEDVVNNMANTANEVISQGENIIKDEIEKNQNKDDGKITDE